jgi:hypothetical protein
MLLGVYSDYNGSPSVLLGVTESTFVNSTEGWQTVDLTNPLTIPQQWNSYTKLWLTYIFENNPGVRCMAETQGSVSSSDTWSSGMPGTFGISNVTDNKYSIYCSLITGTTGSETSLNVSPSVVQLSNSVGSNSTFNITSNTSWSIVDEVDWLEFSSVSGINNETITLTANSENTGTSPRTATITITGVGVADRIVTITQKSGPNLEKTLGNTDVYSSVSLVSNHRAIPVTFNETGVVESISIYHNGGTGNVLLGLYSDESGSPSSRLAVTLPTVINPLAGWQTVVLGYPVSVTSGQTVWLSWVFENNPGVRYSAGTPDNAESFETWQAGIPSMFGTATFASNKYSVYCTYTPVVDLSPTYSEYLFEEISGSTVIDSKGSNDGTIVNEEIRVDGIIGKGLEFNGSGYITLGNSFGENVENAVTLSAWIKPDNTTESFQGVIMHGGPNLDSYALYLLPGLKGIGFKTSGTTNAWTTIDNVTDLWDGNWHHLSVTYDGFQKVIYLDSVVLITVDASGNIESGSGYNLLIGAGRDAVPATNLYKGLIDEVSIYNYALTSTQIGKLYNRVITILSCEQHFHPEWEGTFGFDHMNINVIGAQIEEQDLEPGDEIGVFDGDVCVGYGKVIQTIGTENLLNIVVSRDDGSGNGFTSGNEVSYIVWDCSASAEYPVNNIQCFNNQLTPIVCTTFAPGATTFVSLSGVTLDIQQVALIGGWNIMSLLVKPLNENLLDILLPLIEAGKLKKVMDEEGNTIEDWGVFGSWKNNIGDLINTEGYKISLTSPAILEVAGVPVQFPYDIELNTGWNIISWPAFNEQDGADVFQELIDSGKLKKVMDETGKTIEDWGVFGGWKNIIGNFKPGEGYKVNVTSACTLIINENGTKSTGITTELIASSHFIPVFQGNGIDHMNVNLVNLAKSGIMEGDEIGIFDGDVCVGSAKISIHPSIENGFSISLPVSASDNTEVKNGFTNGNIISLRLYRNGIHYPMALIPLNKNKAVFEKGSSLFAQIDLATGLSEMKNNLEVKCYPNPFIEKVTIEILLIEKQKIDVNVYDIKGALIRNLYANKAEGKVTLYWDGKNQKGIKMVTGTFFIKVNETTFKVLLE